MIARFSMQDNVTAVVEAFTNYFELDIDGYESIKLAILRRALDAMAPGDPPVCLVANTYPQLLLVTQILPYFLMLTD